MILMLRFPSLHGLGPAFPGVASDVPGEEPHPLLGREGSTRRSAASPESSSGFSCIIQLLCYPSTAFHLSADQGEFPRGKLQMTLPPGWAFSSPSDSLVLKAQLQLGSLRSLSGTFARKE